MTTNFLFFSTVEEGNCLTTETLVKPKSYQNVISSYSITPESSIKFRRIKEKMAT